MSPEAGWRAIPDCAYPAHALVPAPIPENAPVSPELIAIITASVVILGFLRSLHRDMAGIHRDIAGLHRDVAGVHRDVGDLRERMARLEGLFEGFTRSGSAPSPSA